jgi:uncharacterized protein (TIGR02246 family)
MKKALLLISLALPLCFAFGCQQGQKAEKESGVDVRADAEAIRNLSDEYGAKITAGDIAGFLNLFADNAILMPPNRKMIIGKEEIRPMVQALFKTAKEIDLKETTTPNEIRVFGDWAFDLGITAFESGGKPMENTNKYIRIWQKRADGSWKLARVAPRLKTMALVFSAR